MVLNVQVGGEMCLICLYGCRWLCMVGIGGTDLHPAEVLPVVHRLSFARIAMIIAHGYAQITDTK